MPAINQLFIHHLCLIPIIQFNQELDTKRNYKMSSLHFFDGFYAINHNPSNCKNIINNDEIIRFNFKRLHIIIQL